MPTPRLYTLMARILHPFRWWILTLALLTLPGGVVLTAVFNFDGIAPTRLVWSLAVFLWVLFMASTWFAQTSELVANSESSQRAMAIRTPLLAWPMAVFLTICFALTLRELFLAVASIGAG